MIVVSPEIWIHVAKFIPKSELSGMYAINATFFNLAMDVRYHEVYITSLNDASLKRIQNLRDPVIAPRIKSLYFNKPQYSRKCGFRDGLMGCGDFDSDQLHHLLGTGHNNEDELSEIVPWPDSVNKPLALQILTDTVTCLVNVTEFSIERSDYTTEDDLLPFFTAAWKTFGSRLSRLYSRNYVSMLLSGADDLTALTRLEVQLDEGYFPDGTVLVTTLAPFINKVAPTLQSLSLAFLGNNWWLPPLFSSLQNIPHLEQLEMSALFHAYGAFTPLGGGLTHFLRNPTLRHVVWASYQALDYLGPTDHHMRMWLEENKDDKFILSNLSTLNIPVPIHGLDLIIPYIRRSTATLTALFLPGCDLDYDGVNTLVSTFAQCRTCQLRRLYIQVQRLTADYIPLIAQCLPGLQHLELNVKLVGATIAGAGNVRSREEMERQRTRDFVRTLRTHDLSGWELRHFGMMVILRTGENEGLDPTLRRVFAECIPSLVTISGMLREDVLAEEIYADLLP